MTRVNTYLNFQGDTEEAFDFYGKVFGSSAALNVQRFGEIEPPMPNLAAGDAAKVLHAELPILAGHVIMGTDMLESFGQTVRIGNNTTISLELDSRQQAAALYDALAEGGSEGSGMDDMPWGAYWGCCLDRYGIRWMFSYTP